MMCVSCCLWIVFPMWLCIISFSLVCKNCLTNPEIAKCLCCWFTLGINTLIAVSFLFPLSRWKVETVMSSMNPFKNVDAQFKIVSSCCEQCWNNWLEMQVMHCTGEAKVTNWCEMPNTKLTALSETDDSLILNRCRVQSSAVNLNVGVRTNDSHRQKWCTHHDNKHCLHCLEVASRFHMMNQPRFQAW